MMKGTFRAVGHNGRKALARWAWPGFAIASKPRRRAGRRDAALVVDAVGAGAARSLQGRRSPQFEAANPGIKVVFEPTSDEGYSAQLAAAFASEPGAEHRHPPAVLRRADLLLAQRPGRAVRRRHPDDRRRTSTIPAPTTSTRPSNGNLLRHRHRQHRGRHAVAAQGPDGEGRHRGAPKTWDELRAAARKMQGGGIYGAPLPYGLEQHDVADLHRLHPPRRRQHLRARPRGRDRQRGDR